MQPQHPGRPSISEEKKSLSISERFSTAIEKKIAETTQMDDITLASREGIF